MMILKACKEIKSKNIDFNVVFTITGAENAYAVKLKEYSKINDLNVVSVGMLRRQEVLEYYTKSVLLFPSIIETDALLLKKQNHRTVLFCIKVAILSGDINGLR